MGRIGDVKTALVWLFRLRRARNAVKKYQKEKPMDWGKTLLKGLVTLLHYLLALGVTAVLAGLTPQAVTDALLGAGVPAFLVNAILPVILAGIVMAQNWWKHRNEPSA